MPFGINKLTEKMQQLEKTTGKLEVSIHTMSQDLSEFKNETKNLKEQLHNLTESVNKLAKVFEIQVESLNESLQTLGKNLTQNVVENILSLPKMVPDFLKKKRDHNTSNSK
ncbi:MAG: hypothetical protein JW776_11270 [Candidatus Lokiarchaeota archaeon]|nr:hypothetical protein [Candidatus Lokiarchaeota archaeon]